MLLICACICLYDYFYIHLRVDWSSLVSNLVLVFSCPKKRKFMLAHWLGPETWSTSIWMGHGTSRERLPPTTMWLDRIIGCLARVPSNPSEFIPYPPDIACQCITIHYKDRCICVRRIKYKKRVVKAKKAMFIWRKKTGQFQVLKTNWMLFLCVLVLSLV